MDAHATLESGGVETGGTILDVSFGGVRMRLASSPFLDSACIFTAADFGVRVPGWVVWRRGSEVGIRFLEGTAPPSPAPAFGRRRPQ